MGIVININSDDGVDVVRSSETTEPQHLGTLERNFIDLTGVPKAKKEKLLHYSGRDAKAFFQFDAFTNIEAGDDIMRPDEDGDWVCGGTTTELMFGATVRVLVAPGTTRKTAARALQKIQDWIEKEEGILNPKNLPGMADAQEAPGLPESEMPF
jgi:hypothetical protein